MKRKRKKRSLHKKEDKYQESTGKHIVVVSFENDTISDIFILDVDEQLCKNIENKENNKPFYN